MGKDLGKVLGKVKYCLGALGFELCFGLLYLLWWVALFRDCCIVFWEVLCVLRDLRVEVLGGLRNGLKV